LVILAFFHAILVTVTPAIKVTFVTHAIMAITCSIIHVSTAVFPIAIIVSKVTFAPYVLISTVLKINYVYSAFLRARPVSPMEAV
jgi:hypothetical protein